MTRFSASKKQLRSLLVMFICSIVISIVGIYFLVYDANHFCDDYIKIAGYLFIIVGIFNFISTIFSYLNTTFEVIINDDFICINKAGFSEAKSQIVNFSDIISVSCAKKVTPITKQLVTSVCIVTKIGTKIINNIQNPDELTKVINEKIDTEEQ